MKFLKTVTIILLPAFTLAATGFYGELWFVNGLMDRHNPQDVTGVLAIFAIPAAGIGFLIGTVIGGVIVYVHSKHRSSV